MISITEIATPSSAITDNIEREREDDGVGLEDAGGGEMMPHGGMYNVNLCRVEWGSLHTARARPATRCLHTHIHTHMSALHNQHRSDPILHLALASPSSSVTFLSRILTTCARALLFDLDIRYLVNTNI